MKFYPTDRNEHAKIQVTYKIQNRNINIKDYRLNIRETIFRWKKKTKKIQNITALTSEEIPDPTACDGASEQDPPFPLAAPLSNFFQETIVVSPGVNATLNLRL